MRRVPGAARPLRPADSRSFCGRQPRSWGVLGECFTSRWSRRGFTRSETALTIVSVRSWTELLTKRRAVDFCRVATALCPAA
ncbi:putative leader peptide [Actinoallomurus acanthiterrae]